VLFDSVAVRAGEGQALPRSPARIVPSPPEGVNEAAGHKQAGAGASCGLLATVRRT